MTCCKPGCNRKVQSSAKVHYALCHEHTLAVLEVFRGPAPIVAFFGNGKWVTA